MHTNAHGAETPETDTVWTHSPAFACRYTLRESECRTNAGEWFGPNLILPTIPVLIATLTLEQPAYDRRADGPGNH